MSETPTADPAEAAAVLRGMAEHGIRIDDRKFERYTLALLADYDRMRRNLDDREQAADAARQAAARIDVAFSHGVPSGSEDPVTAGDWDRLLRYARCGGTERPV